MFSRFKRSKKSARHFDVRAVHPARRTVVSLRKRAIHIELSRESLNALGRFLHNRFLLVVPILAVILIIIGTGYAWQAKADALLYPTSCLGAWQGSEHASGAPNTLGQPDDAYTEANSATITDSLGQIFCGSFTGDIPKDSAPTSLTVTLSLAVKTPGAPVTITNQDFASSTNAILDAPADSSSQLLIEIPSSAPDASAGAQAAPASSPDSGTPPPDAVPTPTAPPAPPAPDVSPPAQPPAPDAGTQTRAHQSWLDELLGINPAFAMDNTGSSTAPTASSTTAGTTDSGAADDSFAEVLYTFDGTTWTSLGRISWANARIAKFTIPLEGVKSWDDLSKLQVSVRTLSSLSGNQILYLDGMQLSVGYKNEIAPLPPSGDPDPKSFHVSVAPHGGTKLIGRATNDGAGQEQIEFSGVPGTGFKVFSLADPSFGLVSSFGDDPMVMTTSNFKDGNFIMIDTANKSGCADLRLEECRAAAGYIDETAFSVTSHSKPVLVLPDVPIGTASSTDAASTSATLQTP